MSCSIRTFIMASALVVIGASATAAQTGAVLSGVVRDHAGNPVPGVVLTIVGPTSPEPRVVVTDQRGAYFVDRLHYGFEYAVYASHPRFRKSRVQASANEGEIPVDVTLNPQRTRFARFVLFSWRALRLGLMEHPRTVARSGA